MILDATTKKLQVVLAGAVTTNQLHVNATWADTQNGATFVPGSTSLVTNGATPVDIVAAPAASTQRQVKEVTIQNTDTVAATVTVQTVDGANTRKNIVVTIQSGETLFFAGGVWNVLGTNGALKTGNGVSSVALTVPSRQTVTGSPITTAGTLAVTDNSQSANTVFAGPASGAAAGPAFRTLAAADLNSLSFTAGSVLFGNASGGIGQDNSQLFWDDTNHYLGVGTLTPAAPIHSNASGVTPTLPFAAGVAAQWWQGGSLARQLYLQIVGGAPVYVCSRANGTWAAQTAIINGDTIGTFSITGYDGAAYAAVGNFGFLASENWAAGTNRGLRFELQLVPNGSITRAAKLTVFGDGRMSPVGAYCSVAYSRQVPLTGFAITVANTADTLILEPAGLLATGTVTMAAAPIDGQEFNFTCTQAVTALTIQANAGQTMLAPFAGVAYVANTGFGWKYLAATTAWYRIHN